MDNGIHYTILYTFVYIQTFFIIKRLKYLNCDFLTNQATRWIEERIITAEIQFSGFEGQVAKMFQSSRKKQFWKESKDKKF